MLYKSHLDVSQEGGGGGGGGQNDVIKDKIDS